MHSKIDISVIIVSYNTKMLTMRCIESIQKSSGDLNVEIIVVDNCSSDGSAQAIAETYPDLIVINAPENGGFAYGNNIGLSISKGEYILLLNPDTEITESALKDSICFMRSNPQTGIMGPHISYPNGDHQNSVIRDLSLKTLFFLIFLPSSMVVKNPLLGDHRYGNLDPNQPNEVDSVMGSFMLVPKKLIDDAGPLNDQFFMYGEECEWSHRIRKLGKKVIYNPAIEIAHHSGASTEDIGPWKAVEMTRGHILFLRFTRGKAIAWIGCLLMLCRDLIRIPFHGFVAISRGFKWSNSALGWKARLKFLCRAIFKLPRGQKVTIPNDIFSLRVAP